MFPIRNLQGRALHHPEGGQILSGEHPTSGAHVPRDPLRQGTRIEVPAAIRGEILEEGGKVQVHQAIPLAEVAPARLEEGPSRGSEGQDRAQQVEKIGLVAIEADAVPGQADRRRQHLPERQPTQSFVDVQVALQVAGNRSGSEPGIEDLIRAGKANGHGKEVRLQVGRRQTPAGRVDEEIEQGRAPLRPSREQKPTAAETRQGGLGDGRGETRRNGGVHGIAPLAKHARRRCAHARVARRHHPLTAPRKPSTIRTGCSFRRRAPRRANASAPRDTPARCSTPSSPRSRTRSKRKGMLHQRDIGADCRPLRRPRYATW
jgi:hypothetical protein